MAWQKYLFVCNAMNCYACEVSFRLWEFIIWRLDHDAEIT